MSMDKHSSLGLRRLLPRVAIVIGLAGVMAFAGTFGGRGKVEAASITPAPHLQSIAADSCTSVSYGYTQPGYFGGYPYGGYPVAPESIGGIPIIPQEPCTGLASCTTVDFYGAILCPGPAATVEMPASPTSVSCGSASDISVKVVDANGLAVTDGTPVTFTSSLGEIGSSASTTGGSATASLNIPPQTSGTAQITVTSGSATGSEGITATC